MANIIFYPYHATTNGDLIDGDIDVAASGATGFSSNNLLDRSRWTQWKANAASTNYTFRFDLNSTTRTVNYVIIAGHDVVTQLTNSPNLVVKHDDNAQFSSPTTVVNGVTIDAEPHQLFTFSAPATTERHWRIDLKNSPSSGKPSLGSIFLGEKITSTTFQDLGDAIGQTYSSTITESPTGRFSSKLNRKPRNVWNLQYRFMSETFRTNLQRVLTLTRGSHYPLFMSDDEGNLFFVRLFPPYQNYTPTRTSHQIYEQELTIVQEDFVDFADGDGIAVR